MIDTFETAVALEQIVDACAEAFKIATSRGEQHAAGHFDQIKDMADVALSAIRARSNDAQPDDSSTARSTAPSPIGCADEVKSFLAGFQCAIDIIAAQPDERGAFAYLTLFQENGRRNGRSLSEMAVAYASHLRAQHKASNKAWDDFQATLDNPPPANDALKELMRSPVQTGAAGSVPGWKLMPEEPTPEMIEASALAWTRQCHGYPPTGDHPKFMAGLYRAMLSSSPSPPVQERQEVGGGEDYRSMTYQTRLRAQHDRERFDFVLGKAPKMISGKGKYYLLNFIGLKEAYEAAKKDCPIAADAICAQIWDRVTDMQTLAWLAKDFEAELHREPQPVGGGE